MSSRSVYWILTLILFGTEIVIGVFVHDQLIRPYVGDVLVVILIYTLIRALFPVGLPYLIPGIFLFSVCVEFLQLIGIADLLHIENHIVRTLIGTAFSWIDILCYAVGCSVTVAAEWLISRRKSNS